MSTIDSQPSLEQVEAPLRGLIHSLHRDDLRHRVERMRWSRRAAAQKVARSRSPTKSSPADQ